MLSTYAKFILVLAALVGVTIGSPGHAAVEISLQTTLETGAVPMDVTVSPDGRLTFVLTDDGKVMIYDNHGNLTDNVKVGTHIDQIEMGPSGERLFATSRQNKTVEIIRLDFINDINSEGSFLKGPANAPVTIAVFSEFQ
jgi:DNA-binding beta-propeller fold protein YncE